MAVASPTAPWGEEIQESGRPNLLPQYFAGLNYGGLGEPVASILLGNTATNVPWASK